MSNADRLTAALDGRYRIERELGAGGMATVYLARDLKHHRHVALKVLRPELGAVVGVERFLSEIQVTANLQHPNLLPLFDSGEAGGLLFYVMPFVEGESLRARLEREKQLPVDEAVRIATAIAGALEYAHQHGVIHRDLKPENILLQASQPVIADFGIALAVSNAGGARVTQTGLSLGTPQYMSPEQATGDRVIDSRTDIYSLAAMTYEMLTGEPPHTGTSAQAIIARLMTEAVRPLTVLRHTVPRHVDAAVRHGLEKLAADRFATAGEFADALTGKLLLDAPPHGATTGQGSRPRGWAAAFAVMVLVWAATMVPAVRGFAPPPDAAEVRFDIPVASQTQGLQIAVSPDGKHVAFTTPQAAGGRPMLWVRSLASSSIRVLPGTEGAGRPFWSPDSREIAYFVGDKLLRIPVAGGSPQQIVAGTSRNDGGTWNRDGVIVYASGVGLFRVTASGGPATQLPLTGIMDRSAGNPQFLPDGRHILFTSRNVGAAGGQYVVALGDSAPKRILQVDVRAVYSPLGYLLFMRGATLHAQRFDTRRLELTGEPVVVADGIGVNLSASGMTGFDVSAGNVLVFRQTGAVAFSRQLEWYSREGQFLGAAGDTGTFTQVTMSPDERFIAVDRDMPGYKGRDVWIVDVASNIMSRLTMDSLGRGAPVWFPDSRSVVFQSLRRGSNNFYRKALGGATDTIVFESPDSDKFTEEVTPDGRSLLFHSGDTLLALPLEGVRTPRVLAEIARVDEVRLSPDGTWIAYSSTESGRFEVYVASYPALRDRRQVSAAGGGQPRWRGDGKELFYLTDDGMVMAAGVKPGTAMEFAAPTPLFRSPIQTPSFPIDQWAVARDGRRFLFNAPKAVGDSSSFDNPFTVVVNWTNVLRNQKD